MHGKVPELLFLAGVLRQDSSIAGGRAALPAAGLGFMLANSAVRPPPPPTPTPLESELRFPPGKRRTTSYSAELDYVNRHRNKQNGAQLN